MILGAIVASMIMVGCGSSNSSTNSDTNTTTTGTNTGGTSTRFTTMDISGDTVRRNETTKLEWVGSSGKNGTNACKPHPAATTEDADIASAKAHCSALDFAGHMDWRVATKAEHKEFVTGMSAAGIVPYYVNPKCPRLIGVDGSVAIAVNTHNSTPVGAYTTWDNLLKLDKTNFGVKCVRAQ